MITPKIGNHYVIHHSSGNIVCRFVTERVFNPSFRSSYRMIQSQTRYYFTNLKTGREIVLKSRAKIRREVTFDSPEHMTENQVVALQHNWE